jgi:hypothetical protein
MLPRTSARGTPAFFTEGRDQRLVEIVYSYLGETNEKEKIDEFPGFWVGEPYTLWAHLFPYRDGLTDNPIHRLGESSGSLVDGISSRQTASAGSVSPVPGTVTSSFCQRMQPTRRRTISLRRRPANNQVMTSALVISIGYAVDGNGTWRTSPFFGRSSVVRLRPAQISLAHTSSAITRGWGR